MLLLLVQPAAAQAATEAEAAATPVPAAATAADEMPISCWVTAYGSAYRYESGILDAIGYFGSKCETVQHVYPDPFMDDPEPPEASTSISASVKYCSYSQQCTIWAGSSGPQPMAPTTPSGIWIDILNTVLYESCKAAIRLPWPFNLICEVDSRLWAYSYHHAVGDYCYTDCREGGTVEYRATHHISIPRGTGYHLQPGLPLSLQYIDSTSGGCAVIDQYNLVCESVYTAKASSPSPQAVVLPPAVQQPVNDAKDECEEQLGRPACNP